MKTAFVCLYKPVRIHFFFRRTQTLLLKEQREIGSAFGGLINACSKIQKINGDKKKIGSEDHPMFIGIQ